MKTEQVQPQEYAITHRTPLIGLGQFCAALRAAMLSRHDEAEVARLWRLYISGECPVCGIPVSGEELHALGVPPDPATATVKTGRLRRGDCARQGCGAYHLTLSLWQQEGLDWPGLLAKAEGVMNTKGAERKRPPLAQRTSAAFKQLGLPGETGKRAAVVAGALLALWVARQLYVGGEIPLFRSPEKFQVEAVPEGSTTEFPFGRSEMGE